MLKDPYQWFQAKVAVTCTTSVYWIQNVKSSSWNVFPRMSNIGAPVWHIQRRNAIQKCRHNKRRLRFHIWRSCETFIHVPVNKTFVGIPLNTPFLLPLTPFQLYQCQGALFGVTHEEARKILKILTQNLAETVVFVNQCHFESCWGDYIQFLS